MRLKTFILLFSLVLVFGMAAVAGADTIANSNHDMIDHDNLGNAASQQGICSFCHLPHGAAGAKLFDPTVIGSPGGGWADDPYAGVCYGCHGTGASLGQQGTATINLNVFDSSSHINEVDQLVTWTDISAVGDLGSFPGYYTTGGASYVSCISCHNVHDNAVRPFLRNNDALDDGTSGDDLAFGDLQTLCDDCHVDRELNAGVTDRINHPSNTALAGTTAGNASLYNYSGGNFASTTQDLFNSGWSDNTQKVAGAGGNHWNLGAKFSNVVTGNFNCGTCHMTHMNEETRAAFGQTDGLIDGSNVTGSAVDWGYNVMLVNDPAPSTGAVAEICVACHNITDANAGPGAVGYSHPFESQFGTSISVTNPDSEAKWGGSLGTSTATIVCQSCHDMHFAVLGDTVAAGGDAVIEETMLTGYCNDCHGGAGGSFKPNHHPTGITVTFGTNIRNDGSNNVDISSGVTWSTLTRTNIDNNTVTRTSAAIGDYIITGNVIDCGTCHGGASATAHNNAASFPGLTGEMDEDEMCVDCHGVNPSYFTEHQTAGQGSHYLGSVLTQGYKWGYRTGAQDSVSPSAGVVTPSYGSDTSADNDLICSSCHTLLTDTWSTAQWSDNGDGSSNAPGSNYEMGASPSGVRNDDNDDNEDSTLDGVGLLLSASGNNATDASGTANDYLCTACHGATPGGGSTHPTMPNFQANMSNIVGSNAGAADNFVTHVGDNTGGSSTGGINCESCHRPHDADTQGSTYILEAAGGVLGTFIDEALLCSSCHLQ